MKPKAKRAQLPGKLTVRLLAKSPKDPQTVLIEGDRATLEWLGSQIVSRARDEDCKIINAGLKGPWSALFSSESSTGIYIHRLPCTSDLYGPSGVITRAHTVLGKRKAAHWLKTPLPILANRSPLEVLETKAGVKKIKRLLTRIEHNIPS